MRTGYGLSRDRTAAARTDWDKSPVVLHCRPCQHDLLFQELQRVSFAFLELFFQRCGSLQAVGLELLLELLLRQVAKIKFQLQGKD